MNIIAMICEISPEQKRIAELESMVESLAVQQNRSPIGTTTELRDVIEAISNVGIMIVLSAVIVLFLMKVLTMLLDQTKKANNEILPKIESLSSKIVDTQSQLSNLIMNHNQSSNKKLSALELQLNQIAEKADRLESRLDDCDNDHKAILIAAEKLEGLIYVRNASAGKDSDTKKEGSGPS